MSTRYKVWCVETGVMSEVTRANYNDLMRGNKFSASNPKNPKETSGIQEEEPVIVQEPPATSPKVDGGNTKAPEAEVETTDKSEANQADEPEKVTSKSKGKR